MELSLKKTKRYIPRFDLAVRNRRILGPVDVSTRIGLEIGPLNNPLVTKDQGPVLYVDFADTQTVRAKPYDSSINPADIVDIDIVWDHRPLIECVGRRVDYVVAAHVIEHVPDIVGWLQDVRGVIRETGWLGLAIPDRRFTFDYARKESTVGEMVEAYLLRYRTPSIRQVFDHCHLAVQNDVELAWEAVQNPAALPSLTDKALALAYDQAVEISAHPRYIDSHCWVFTPLDFLAKMATLAKLSLFPFVVAYVQPTLRGTFEFLVGLQPSTDVNEILTSIERAMSVVEHDADELYYGRLRRPSFNLGPRALRQIQR
jgi:hypothetical protein